MNFKNWNKGKFTSFYFFSWGIYWLIATVAPILYLSIRFNLFEKVEKLSCILIFLIILALIELIKKMKDSIKELPQETIKQARFKFLLEMIAALMIPVGIILLILCIKFEIAWVLEVVVTLCIFQIAAIVFDSFILKFARNEMRLRKHSSTFNEMQDRQELMRD